MKSLLSILTAVAFVTVAFAGPGLAGDEKKKAGSTSDSQSTGGSASGASGTADKPATSDDKGAASPKTGSEGSASPSGASGAGTAAKPASQDDCKDNGWQKFGFKDQVECVAAVAPEKKTQ